MDFNEYQEKAHSTAEYPHIYRFFYLPLKLSGEAGEVAEKMGKIIRDKKGIVTDSDALELKKELGDVLWYVSELALVLGYTLEDIAETNIDKLQSRAARDVIKGSGDNR